MLNAQLTKRRGDFILDATITVASGKPLVIVGESGSGKTTLLRSLAGLDRPEAGSIVFAGSTWFDGERGVSVPSWERPVGFVSQDYALFPHLTALDNVAFGLRARGIKASAARDRAKHELERLGVSDLAARRPDQLSGGQQQRVALARAFAVDPKLLLMDEPLAALDVKTRGIVRAELRPLIAGFGGVAIYVTHDSRDAIALGQQIAALEDGRVTQHGSRDDLLRHPRSAYVAAFVGVNLFQGNVESRANGLAHVRTDSGPLEVVDPGWDGDVYVAVNPRDITLYPERPFASARNTFKGKVVELAPQPPDGDRVRVSLATQPPLVAEVTRPTVESLGLVEGKEIYAGFKATAVSTYR